MAIVRSALVHTTAAAAFLLRRPPRPCVRMMATRTSPVEVAVPGGLTLRGTRYSPSDANSDGGRWLLFHGWLDNSDSFAALAPKLCDADGACIRGRRGLDLAGHGLSDHRNGPYHAVDFAADAIYAANELWGEGCQFNVAGHSLGGGVALMVAGAWPDRIQRVAAIESAGALAGPAADAPSSLRKSCRRPPVGGSRRVFKDAADAAQRRAAKNVMADARFTEREALALTARGLARRRRRALAHGPLAAATLPAPPRSEPGPRLARATTAPALLVLAKDGGFARTGRFVDPSSWWVRVGSALAARVRPGAASFRGLGGAATLADLSARIRALRRRYSTRGRLHVATAAVRRVGEWAPRPLGVSLDRALAVSMTSGLAFLALGSSLTSGERAARCLRDFLSSNGGGAGANERRGWRGPRPWRSERSTRRARRRGLRGSCTPTCADAMSPDFDVRSDDPMAAATLGPTHSSFRLWRFNLTVAPPEQIPRRPWARLLARLAELVCPDLRRSPACRPAG